MNWGNRLLTVFIVFGCLIGYLVYRCSLNKVSLVSGQYYRDELAYQHIIDSRNKASGLTVGIRVEVLPKTVKILFPPEPGDLTGNIHFYCPSDEGKDLVLSVRPDKKGNQYIFLKTLNKGSYIVKITWKAGLAEYYHEQPIKIVL